MVTGKEHDFKPEPPEGFKIDDFFVFEKNIAYQVVDLPKGLNPLEFAGIRDKVFQKHLEYCDKEVRDSWQNGTHLSLEWKNGEAASLIAVELREILKPLGYVEAVGVGYYHGNTIVLFPVLPEGFQDFNITELLGNKFPWFYKGFTIR
ncbi:MAG: hypothetical protein KJ077_44295 [Anaerolineae bacterium]|nr:hypothetical protein [Anaerolineae bacterium]